MVTQVRTVGYSTRKETGRYKDHLQSHFLLQRSSMERSISALRVSLHSILLLGLFYVPWMMGVVSGWTDECIYKRRDEMILFKQADREIGFLVFRWHGPTG